MTKIVDRKDAEALLEYADGQAQQYHGMSYADGIRDCAFWLLDEQKRPDLEEE